MLLFFSEKENKFFYVSEDELKEAPFLTLEQAAAALNITKQGVTRLYGRSLNVVKSVDGKRAIPIKEIERRTKNAN